MVRTLVLLLLLSSAACSPDGDAGRATGEGAAAAAGEGGGPSLAAAFSGEGGRWVDLTHPFSEESVYWPTASGFELDTIAWGPSGGGYFYSAFGFSADEHGGTHLDAPIHFAEGRHAAHEIPLERLVGPAVVVDVSAAVEGAEGGADYRVTVADLEAWEARHGRIPDGAILLLRTGWGARYGDREAYLGTARTGPGAVPDLHFPGLHPDAARWLVGNRRLDAIGIDTPSIDYGQSGDFMAHRVLYGENVPGFENVAGLEALPPEGAFVVALPMKIEGGSGGPLRIVAFVPEGAGRPDS